MHSVKWNKCYYSLNYLQIWIHFKKLSVGKVLEVEDCRCHHQNCCGGG